MAKPVRSIDEQMDEEIARGDLETVPVKEGSTKYTPTYQVVGDSRIPLSKAQGTLWNSRKKQALAKRKSKEYDKAWDEALRYYRNDQTAHRSDGDDPDYDGGEHGAMKLTRKFSETENIVFANTSALVPLLYAKNPTAEFTAVDEDDQKVGVILEKLIARIMSKKAAPGINLKPKVRKAVVMCTLTNAAYIEVGYTFKEQSSDAAMQDLTKLSAELTKAKTPQDIQRIEGQLEALENSIDLLRPAGPFAKFRRPQDVIVDSDALEDDHADAKWIMIADFINTGYINARFRETKNGVTKSLYKPTHVVKTTGDGENSIESEINNFSLFSGDKESNAQSFGYNDEDSYRKAQRTKCWWVWDKITQRVLLYADNDWTWPIWVWDDPYKLQGFFPIYKLQFYTDPEEPTSKGEVTYYLDQQDGINQINSEFKQARQWARRNLFYDKNRISKDEVEKFIKGDEDVAVGVDVPEGMDLKDFISSVPPPSMQFVQLFDKKPLLEAIDRVSSVQPVMRGTEFKTNTTNQAINTYNSMQQTRTDEKIDAVEDFIGQIGWAIAQMCLQFMSQDEVAGLIGDKDAAEWQNLTIDEIARKIQMTVVGGSTQKPTSESKKQQAMQMGQVLGQFVNAAPVPVMMVMLQTMRGAFNDTIPDAQWELIMEAVGQQPPPAPPGAPPGEGAPPEAAPPTAESPQPGDGAVGDQMAALENAIDGMPPEAKQALGAAMAKGVPMREAIQRIMQMQPAPQPEPQQA